MKTFLFVIFAIFVHLVSVFIASGNDSGLCEENVTGFRKHLGFADDGDRTLPVSIGPMEYWSSEIEKSGERCRSLAFSPDVRQYGYIYIRAFLTNDCGFPRFPLNIALLYQAESTNPILVKTATRDKRHKSNFNEIGMLAKKTGNKWEKSLFKIAPEKVWSGNSGEYVFKIETPDASAKVFLSEVRVFMELPCVKLGLTSNKWHALSGYKRRAYACNIAEEQKNRPCLEIRCLSGGEGAGYMQFSETVPVTAGASYALMHETRSIDCLRPFILIYQLDKNGRRLSSASFDPLPGTYDWRLFTGEFKTLPGIGGVNIYFMNKDGGTVQYRDIRLVHLPEN